MVVTKGRFHLGMTLATCGKRKVNGYGVGGVVGPGNVRAVRTVAYENVT